MYTVVYCSTVCNIRDWKDLKCPSGGAGSTMMQGYKEVIYKVKKNEKLI